IAEARPALQRAAGARESDALLLGNRGGPMGPESLVQYVRALGRRADVGGLAPHDLRHAVATHLLRAGLSLRALQLFLGHELLETTARYVHLDVKDLRDALGRAHPLERAAAERELESERCDEREQSQEGDDR
ncbi:MAG: tyrosine-type recombinase/integrase, partial [Myxococcota bacterium]